MNHPLIANGTLSNSGRLSRMRAEKQRFEKQKKQCVRTTLLRPENDPLQNMPWFVIISILRQREILRRGIDVPNWVQSVLQHRLDCRGYILFFMFIIQGLPMICNTAFFTSTYLCCSEIIMKHPLRAMISSNNLLWHAMYVGQERRTPWSKKHIRYWNMTGTGKPL